jgi:hypothetical protein
VFALFSSSFILIPLLLSFLPSFIYSMFCSFNHPFIRWMVLCEYMKGE